MCGAHSDDATLCFFAADEDPSHDRHFAGFAQFFTHLFRYVIFIHSFVPSPEPLKDVFFQQRGHNIMTFTFGFESSLLGNVFVPLSVIS